MLRARSGRVLASLQHAVFCARAVTSYPPKWTKLATKELKGKEPSTLEKATAEDITLKPVYTDPNQPDHVPGVFPYTRGPYATMYTARCVAAL
jgi:Methylmalonyl-CoA mutase